MAPPLQLRKTLRMNEKEENGISMKSLIYSQLAPVKTMKQVVNDRVLYRSLILLALVINWCF